VLADDSPTVSRLIDEMVADATSYLEQGSDSGMLRATEDRHGPVHGTRPEPGDRKGEIDGTLRHPCVHTRVTSPPVGLLAARPRTPDSRQKRADSARYSACGWLSSRVRA
jgi:hypothetical protein